jgi:23S rRNA (cytosine1962-C5)-methyltransferase
MDLPVLTLRNNEEKRLRAGHLWIYSNEVDTDKTPLKSFTPGQQVQVQSSQGKNFGVAYVNPNNLICARILSRSAKPFGRGGIENRLEAALALREACFDKPFYRLVFGESDLMPGLVIDRFGDYFVVQISSAGMEVLKDQIVAALQRMFNPKGILLKNDGKMRLAEGLEEYVSVAFGDVPNVLEFEENGWFYDHRLNRARICEYVKGKRVLDVCSYVGGWGVQAAAKGAAHVTCVDVSEFALSEVQANAALNGVADKVTTIRGDAFEVMEQLLAAKETFDVVILDPPAFIPKKKDVAAGTKAYARMNTLGMKLLGKEGFLLSGSCSMHLAESSLYDLLRQAGRQLDRHVQIIERGAQGPDHPVHPAIVETTYINSLIARVAMIL